MSIELSRASLGDIDALFELSCLVHQRPPYDKLIPSSRQADFLQAFSKGSTFEPKFKAKLARFIQNPNCHVYIAKDGDEIVGYRMAKMQGGDMYLHGLFVHPEHRGKNIGKLLFVKPLSEVPKGKSAHLSVIQNNLPARTLYESKGFVTVGESERLFYGAKQVDMVWRND